MNFTITKWIAVAMSRGKPLLMSQFYDQKEAALEVWKPEWIQEAKITISVKNEPRDFNAVGESHTTPSGAVEEKK